MLCNACAMIELALAAQTKVEIAKKTQLLLQIASSGLKVEEMMEEHASELDFACVRLMEKRIEAAYKQGPLPCPACPHCRMQSALALCCRPRCYRCSAECHIDAQLICQQVMKISRRQDYHEEGSL